MPPFRRALLVAALAALALPLFAAPSAQAGSRARAAALVRKIESRRIKNAKFEDATLPQFVQWVRVATGENVVIRRLALAKAGIEIDDIRITLVFEDVTIATLLRTALEGYGLSVVVKGNVIYVTTRADALGKPVTRLYSISHITWTKVDFIAPEINLRPSDYSAPEEYEPEVIIEDDPLSSGDAVAELLQEIVAPGDWDTEGWGIRATNRYLVVRAPKSVQAKINRALHVIASLK